MSWDQIEIKWSEMVARVQTNGPGKQPDRDVPAPSKPAEPRSPAPTVSATT